MRFTNVIVMLAVSAVCAPALVVGCGGGDDTGTGSEAAASSSGGGPEFPCEPTDPVCRMIESECIALTDNSAAMTFGLRMAQLAVTQPESLAKGTIAGIVASGVKMDLKQCNLDGTGTFSWLLQFDTTMGKLLTGGAKPVSDPTKGYCFVNEMVNGNAIAPVSVDAAPMADGSFSANAGDVTVPIYLDDAGSNAVLLPLHAASLTGTLSADKNCIGSFNYKTLKPEDNCFGKATNPSFTNGGTLSGYIILEDADKIPISTGGTLCTLLAGEALPACDRENGVIKYKGDYCSKAPADTTCGDSVQLKADFAASGVTISGNCQ